MASVRETPDRKHFLIEKAQWSETVALDNLDARIAFYGRLAAKRPQFYEATHTALVEFKAALDARNKSGEAAA